MKPGSEAEKKAEEERQRQQPATDYTKGRYRYPSEFTANESGMGRLKPPAPGQCMDILAPT